MPVCDGPWRMRKQSSKRDGGEANTGQGCNVPGKGHCSPPESSAAPPHGPVALLSVQRHTHSVIESFGVRSWETVRLPEAETCLTVF